MVQPGLLRVQLGGGGSGGATDELSATSNEGAEREQRGPGLFGPDGLLAMPHVNMVRLLGVLVSMRRLHTHTHAHTHAQSWLPRSTLINKIHTHTHTHTHSGRGRGRRRGKRRGSERAREVYRHVQQKYRGRTTVTRQCQPQRSYSKMYKGLCFFAANV